MLKFKSYQSREQMQAAGYVFDDPVVMSRCKHCGEAIEWVTSPRGARLPLTWNTCRCHFDECSGQARPVPVPPPAPADRPRPNAPPAQPATVPGPAGPRAPAAQAPAARPAPAPAEDALQAAIGELAAAVRQLTAALQPRGVTD